MRHEWINKNYENIKSWLYSMTLGKNPDVIEDFIHEVILIFLQDEKADELIERGEARWYIVRIGLNQWRSRTSDFHKTYRPPFNEFLDNVNSYIDREYNEELDLSIETLLSTLQELYEGTDREKYYSLIILFYITIGKNFSEISRRLDIPRNTISVNFRDGIKVLKEKYEENINNEEYVIKNEKIIKTINLNYFKNYGKKQSK